MNRRRYLALCGVAAVGPLAGCSAFDPPGDDPDERARTTVDGPAQFDRVVVGIIGTPSLDGSITVRVSAYNYGSEPGTFTDTLALAEGPGNASKRVRITDVPPGEREHVDLELSVSGAGRYRFRLEEADVYATATVAAERAEPGETLELDGFRMTAEGVTFESGAVYEFREHGRRRQGLLDPSVGNVFAVVRGTVENTTGEERTFDASALSVPGGEGVRADRIGDLRAVTSLRGASLAGATIDAGERLEGWLLADVDPDAVREEGIALSWQSDDVAAPEKQWQFPAPDALAEFAVESFEAPRKATAGDVEFAATVRNDGDAEGTFRGAVDRRADGFGWEVVAVREATLAPGQSATFTGTATWPYVDWTAWRLRPFHEKAETEYEPPSVEFGQRVPAVDGSTLAVSNPRVRDSYVYETTVEETVTVNGTGNVTETETRTRTVRRVQTPTDFGERRFLFVDVEVVAGRGGGRLPQEGQFAALVGGEEFGVDHAHRPVEPEVSFFQAPEEGEWEGETVRGTLVFGVPAGTTRGAVAVRYRESYPKRTVEATWR